MGGNRLKKSTILRPIPPANIGNMDQGWPLMFVPAPDMPEWAIKTFLDPDSKLYNPDHFHLFDALEESIGFMWASSGFNSKGNHVIGFTEELVFRAHKWAKWRQEQQMNEWFGESIPDFLITLDASYCAKCSDTEFCMLVEHEMYHIGQSYKDGMPQFEAKTGRPKLEIRGHDVEEFVGVVRRYGAGHPEGRLSQLVKAGNSKPEIAQLDIQRACGTCLMRAA
jgi:hypothetical protein